MANPNEYLVFEADQVLTNDHLNQMFYYLDQQNRWTRNKLIGMGIVCGLNLVQHAGVIEITKGCGITSQGYLILLDDSQYTYYTTYNAIDTPNDLPFTYPGDLPFYKTYCAGKNIYLLLTDDDYNALESDQQLLAKTISSAPDKYFDDYVVVLFLEANEMDLKNCDAFDCNNKGEKMMLQVRPLLVKKSDLPNAANNPGNNSNTAFTNAPVVGLKRFNVPYTDLQTSDDVINAFINIVDDATLAAVANAYIFCFTSYSYLLDNPSDFSTLLNDLKNFRTIIIQKNPLFIQYFYDFIDDLIKAYKEFNFKISELTSACCGDENLFPLHLVLGQASLNTSSFTHDAFRTYFIYSPLFSKQNQGISETAFLYRRMEILVKEFTILFQDAFRENTIKINPSQYQFHWLSQRAIPYYYNVNDDGNELYQFWSYYQSGRGMATYNVGYNADLYSTDNTVIQPLLYDIEKYNFFRIEGHIGKNYSEVLKNILGQRLTFNLPFDVVAVSADQLPASNTNLPECNILDLETDYKLIISELACKIHTPFCLVTRFPYPPPQLTANASATEANFSSLNSLKAEAVQNISASLATLAVAYKKGDFMRKYCTPSANTVGSFYLNSLNTATGFVNPIQQVNSKDFNSLLYYHIFDFVDAVEDLMLIVMTYSVATLDIAQFQVSYSRAKSSASLLSLLLAEYYENAIANDIVADWLKELELDVIVEEFMTFVYSCIDERMQTLKSEYNRRLQLYQLQLNFLYYYRKHPGLEHKAGVPKGGTFVLVYHSENQPAILAGRQGASLNTNVSITNKIPDISLNTATINLIRGFVDDCNDAPPDKKKNIIDILTYLQQPQPKFQIPSNVVIADFYIPYLCCSDCPPVAYVIQPSPDTVQFDIQPRIFLFDDAHNYPFTTNQQVTPTDFDTTTNPGNLNLLMDNDKLSLHPAMDIKTTLNTTLIYKSIAIPITIVVPDASFTVNVTADVTGAPLVALAAKNTDATTYQWLINDKENVFESKANPAPVSLNTLQKSFDTNEFRIEFIITYVINDNTSSDDRKALLTTDLIIKNLGQGPFELAYINEFNSASSAPQAVVSKNSVNEQKTGKAVLKTRAVKPKVATKDPSINTPDNTVKPSNAKKAASTSKKQNKKP